MGAQIDEIIRMVAARKMLAVRCRTDGISTRIEDTDRS
jgi:hypothetical protein